jgi:hypothetical protein
VTADLWFPDRVRAGPEVRIGLSSGGREADRSTFGSRWDCGRDRICREFEVAAYRAGVDDDPLVLEVTADMVTDLSCEVVTAPSGMDALGASRKTRI